MLHVPAFLPPSKLYIQTVSHQLHFSIIGLLLTLSGDIELNPGPVRFPCAIYNRAVKSNQRGMCYDQCDRWFHVECTNISCDEYTRLSNSSESWVCAACFHALTARQDQQDRHHEAREHAWSYCQRVIKCNNRKFTVISVTNGII